MRRVREPRGTSAHGVTSQPGPGAEYGARAHEHREEEVDSSTGANGTNNLDDDHYPAYTMGRAAEMIGATAAFLRALDEARLITPLRSEGGHRRFSRYQLRIAQRARDLVDQGHPVESACRIVILEDQLAQAQHLNAALRTDPAAIGQDGTPPGTDTPTTRT